MDQGKAKDIGGQNSRVKGHTSSFLSDNPFTFVETPFILVSLAHQVHARFREPKIELPAGFAVDRSALPVTEMRPWFLDISDQIRSLFEKPKPQLVALSSSPIEVPEIWRDYQMQPASWMNSVLVHALVIFALTLPFIMSRPRPVIADGHLKPLFFNLPNKLETANTLKGPHHGGGGGDRSPRPASIGRLPKFDKLQFAPPSARQLIVAPLLPVTPTLLGPPELKLPEMALNMPIGDPRGVPGPPSQGPGTGGGIGPGDGTGIGPGSGGGYGPGDGDGAPVSSVGGNVSAPKPVFSPPPDYSEQARKAKFQGVVTLSLVVDARGNPIDVRVVKSLGMGLDEKALEKVRTWKFVPGARNGIPVPVRVMLEISFRLF